MISFAKLYFTLNVPWRISTRVYYRTVIVYNTESSSQSNRPRSSCKLVKNRSPLEYVTVYNETIAPHDVQMHDRNHTHNSETILQQLSLNRFNLHAQYSSKNTKGVFYCLETRKGEPSTTSTAKYMANNYDSNRGIDGTFFFFQSCSQIYFVICYFFRGFEFFSNPQGYDK